MHRRLCMMVLASTVLAVAIPGVASAKTNNGVRPNQGGCPPGAWVANDESDWVAATFDGFASEGYSPQQAADEFFGGDLEGFTAAIGAGVFGADGIDFNGDGVVCRATNNPGGLPDFFFLVDDNKFNAKFAG